MTTENRNDIIYVQQHCNQRADATESKREQIACNTATSTAATRTSTRTRTSTSTRTRT